jgi:5-methyltetrahydropteroyltriglutamate--homocysteine methyltransferase
MTARSEAMRVKRTSPKMKKSENRILTTHTGSLPRPRDLLLPLHAKDSGEPYDAAALDRQIAQAIDSVVRMQTACGIDLREYSHRRP